MINSSLSLSSNHLVICIDFNHVSKSFSTAYKHSANFTKYTCTSMQLLPQSAIISQSKTLCTLLCTVGYSWAVHECNKIINNLGEIQFIKLLMEWLPFTETFKWHVLYCIYQCAYPNTVCYFYCCSFLTGTYIQY